MDGIIQLGAHAKSNSKSIRIQTSTHYLQRHEAAIGACLFTRVEEPDVLFF
ncbi:hypothetical protein ACEQPO_29180 [Bacillus sp. SL00103]